MRSALLVVPLVLAAVALADEPAAAPPQKDRAPVATDKKSAPKSEPKASRPGWALAAGKNLPGPIHAYYVSGPYMTRLRQENKDAKKVFGRFHCPISHPGLEPIVLLFVRDLRVNDALKDLLHRLDSLVEKNPYSRISVGVVFISAEVKDVVTEDDLREDLATKLEDLAGELKISHIALCLDGPADVEKYELDPEETYTLVLARRYAVLASETLPRDKLTPQKVAQIVDEVAKTFGAKHR